MSISCSRCARMECDTYEFDVPLDHAVPKEEVVPGRCPDCGGSIAIYLSRTPKMQ
ncbi:MAG TPA: hypothetical protein VNS88_16270 [Nitrospiraceae bacterium]|nr:hypothetical protein [Nitrospiraceae bacterium]